MTPEQFVQRLHGAKPRGQNKWMACCPAHEDRDPSLAIAATPQGKILLKCYAGCSALDVVQSLGLELKDLFQDEYTEDPMAFARKEMAQRKAISERINTAKTYLMILTAKLKRGDSVTEQEIEKGRHEKAYLQSQGVA